jgi:hypothetical protein
MNSSKLADPLSNAEAFANKMSIRLPILLERVRPLYPLPLRLPAAWVPVAQF